MGEKDIGLSCEHQYNLIHGENATPIVQNFKFIECTCVEAV